MRLISRCLAVGAFLTGIAAAPAPKGGHPECQKEVEAHCKGKIGIALLSCMSQNHSKMTNPACQTHAKELDKHVATIHDHCKDEAAKHCKEHKDAHGIAVCLHEHADKLQGKCHETVVAAKDHLAHYAPHK